MKTLLDKAEQARRGAHILLEAGLYEDTVSRAYYAMFDAARAYLATRNYIDPPRIKSHARVVGLFGKASMELGEIPTDQARALSRTLSARIGADYEQHDVPREVATLIVAEMDRLLDTIQALLRNSK